MSRRYEERALAFMGHRCTHDNSVGDVGGLQSWCHECLAELLAEVRAEVRRETIEECAAICDAAATAHPPVYFIHAGHEDERLAARIRALLDKPEGE